MEKDNKIIGMPGKKKEEEKTDKENREVKDMQDVCIGLSNTIAIPVPNKLSPGTMSLSVQTLLSPCIKERCHHWDPVGLRCKLENS